MKSAFRLPSAVNGAVRDSFLVSACVVLVFVLSLSFFSVTCLNGFSNLIGWSFQPIRASDSEVAKIGSNMKTRLCLISNI